MYTLLKKIDRAKQLRGYGGVSNAVVGAPAISQRLERRTTSLDDAAEASMGVAADYEDAIRRCKDMSLTSSVSA
jgi:hypothetical protein